MKFRYFAYGSNMLTERLRARCPSAMVVGIAKVDNYVLEFSKPSLDNSGKATLSWTAGAGYCSIGVVFQVLEGEREKLDRAEGSGYARRDDFGVQLLDSRTRLDTSFCFAEKTDCTRKPYDWYLALVIAGARQHKLPDEYVSTLCRIDYDVDSESRRSSRQEALRALNQSGFVDFRQLLSP